MNTDRPRPERAFLRRSVLSVVVLDDLDVDLDDAGVHVPGCARLEWSTVAAWAAAESAEPGPEGPEEGARARVRDLLLAHRELHRARARRVVLAVPRGATRHPGAGWSATPVLGGALDLGLGVVVPDGRTERTLPVPRVSARAVGSAEAPSPGDLEHLEVMGDLLVQRLRRDAGARGGSVLRPVGGCDVPTLLSSQTLRQHLVAGPDRSPGSLLRAVAVPDRTRGWFDLARIDPAYTGAAWAATDLRDRGFRRPVLVTREEVARAPESPRLAEYALRDA